jgi:hypothetical protein
MGSMATGHVHGLLDFSFLDRIMVLPCFSQWITYHNSDI